MRKSLLELQTTPALIIGLKDADLSKAIKDAEQLHDDMLHLIENLKAEEKHRNKQEPQRP